MANNEISYDFTNGTISLTTDSGTKTTPNTSDDFTINGVWTFGDNLRANARWFKARRTTTQSIAATTWTKIALNVESNDPDGWYDSTTNYRWTPQLPGPYLIGGNVTYTPAASGERKILTVYQNGSQVDASLGYLEDDASSSTLMTISGATTIYMNGTTDYVELYTYSTIADDINGATFWGVYLGAQ